MKTLMIFLAISTSLSSFGASLTELKNILNLKEVIKLVNNQSKKGLSLSTVIDKKAETGRVPRCICDSYELIFNNFNAGMKTTEVFSVTTNGFGPGLNVKVNKIDSITEPVE